MEKKPVKKSTLWIVGILTAVGLVVGAIQFEKAVDKTKKENTVTCDSSKTCKIGDGSKKCPECIIEPEKPNSKEPEKKQPEAIAKPEQKEDAITEPEVTKPAEEDPKVVVTAEPPKEVIFENPKKGNVTFNHAMHAEGYECMDCHHKMKEGEDVQSCRSCHSKKFNKAFHGKNSDYSCVGCHQNSGSGPGYTPCSGCHKK